MFKALLSQKGKGIFQSSLSPAVFTEVVLEKLSHLLIVLRPDEENSHFQIHKFSHSVEQCRISLQHGDVAAKNNSVPEKTP